MNRYLFIFALIVFWKTNSIGQTPTVSGYRWDNVGSISDIFSSPDSLTTTNWFISPDWNSYEFGLGYDGVTNALILKTDGSTDEYSAYLQSNYYLKYGYYEINARFYPNTSSLTNTGGGEFWMYKQACPDLPCQVGCWRYGNTYSEIDIFENGVTYTPIGGPTNNINQYSVPNIHLSILTTCSISPPPTSAAYVTDNTHPYNTAGSCDPDNSKITLVPGLSGATIDNAFHKYGVDVHKNYIDFYFDDLLIKHYTSMDNAPGDCITSPTQFETFDKHIFMNVILSAKNFDAPADTKVMDVEYYKFYKSTPRISDITYTMASSTVAIKSSTELDESSCSYGWTINSAHGTKLSDTYTSQESTVNLSLNSGISNYDITCWNTSLIGYSYAGGPNECASVVNSLSTPQTPTSTWSNGAGIQVNTSDVILKPGFVLKPGETFRVVFN
ncbi:MAG: hypothetical protein Q8M29_02960 [Bacteroidota bacterium]|nr:hypothetical protein [Bacteroidota bacterium]